MLQIATGRFFDSPNMYEHEGTGVLYSNYSWIREVATCGGTLAPADANTGKAPTVWVLRYVNRMERSEPGPGVLVRVGDAELVEQFQLLCTIGLGSFFHVDRDVVVHTCRTGRGGQHDRTQPSAFVTRIVDPMVRGDADDERRLSSFIGKALALPRVRYRAVIACARAFCDSLVVASYNLHLAYSMLVYSLESLSQQFDEFTPTWNDYDERVRVRLDRVLQRAPSDVADEVRAMLTDSAHQKLTARFVDFADAHVEEVFYLNECPESTGPIRASDLRRLLRSAYAARSGFVHKLEPLRDHLCDPQIARSEVLEWDHEIFLTYRGLVRLVRHVLLNFVMRGPHLLQERFGWRSELPGIIQMKVAPKHWVWKANAFDARVSHRFLEGFIGHLNIVMATDEPICDMREVIAKCCRLLPTAKPVEQRSMVLLVALYNSLVVEEFRTDDWERHVDDHGTALEDCCVERLLSDAVFGYEWSWSAQECGACVDEYLRTRHRKSALRLPPMQRSVLMLGVYNVLLREAKVEEARCWARRAILDEAGSPGRQSAIQAALETPTEIELRGFMWPRLRPDTDGSTA
ncbi:MAG: hypothetical protein OXU20_32000 [Myxococcales bacterium]|nr:hypothetical protein [Myxococcales bacterium]